MNRILLVFAEIIAPRGPAGLLFRPDRAAGWLFASGISSERWGLSRTFTNAA
jgi:hypothetical protein